ncbi:hypothetical protein [Plantactinospora sp. CA-290183]|uniref:hypothetical protein n=1 Tax=Plantactinospora sp. CA-290183 TaxID=3240006 RepID=UPI003D8B0906
MTGHSSAIGPGLRIVASRRLQTPVCYYEDEADRRLVTVVGTWPIGASSYYAQLREIIADRAAQGAAVHYERDLACPPEDEERATADEGRVLEQLARAVILQDRRAGEIGGWVDRRRGLQPSDGWHGHDVRASELVRLAGLSEMQPVAEGACRRMAWPDGAWWGPPRYRLAVVGAARRAARRRFGGRRLPGEHHPALLGYRAGPAIDALNAGTDLVLVWDVEVLPTLCPELARNCWRSRICPRCAVA